MLKQNFVKDTLLKRVFTDLQSSPVGAATKGSKFEKVFEELSCVQVILMRGNQGCGTRGCMYGYLGASSWRASCGEVKVVAVKANTMVAEYVQRYKWVCLILCWMRCSSALKHTSHHKDKGVTRQAMVTLFRKLQRAYCWEVLILCFIWYSLKTARGSHDDQQAQVWTSLRRL